MDDAGRISDPTLFILASLAGGPKHGYAMARDIEQLSGVRLGAGTLYGAINRLVDDGLIEPLDADDRRKPYALTQRGSRSLEAKLRSMAGFAAIAMDRIRQSQPRNDDTWMDCAD